MKRKSSPIPPGITMLSTDPMEYHLTDSSLSYVGWWNPNMKDIISLTLKCSVVLSHKASTSTIDNNKRWLTDLYRRSLDIEDARKNGKQLNYGYRHQSPFINTPVNITVQQIPNTPMTGIKVVGCSPYLSNQAQVLVLLPGDYLYVMDQSSFVESVARGDVINGVLQGEFIWASNGNRFFLLKKDSKYHDFLLKTED